MNKILPRVAALAVVGVLALALFVAFAPPAWAKDAESKLATGNEQAILATICVTLAIAVLALSGYVVKLHTEQKGEVKKMGEAHAKTMDGVYKLLAKEKEDRRIDQAGTLKEVLETAQAMSKSMDAHSKTNERFMDMIRREQL